MEWNMSVVESISPESLGRALVSTESRFADRLGTSKTIDIVVPIQNGMPVFSAASDHILGRDNDITAAIPASLKGEVLMRLLDAGPGEAIFHVTPKDNNGRRIYTVRPATPIPVMKIKTFAV
jgi:hypothetical protein